MLTLYTKTGCQFSDAVKETLARLGVQYTEKNITENKNYEAELMEIGGTDQAPFLVDEARKESIYESADIIAYLEANYG